MKNWKITTPALWNKKGWQSLDDSYIDLCKDVLARRWEIPKTAKCIWLVGSNCRSREALFFRLTKVDGWANKKVRWSNHKTGLPRYAVGYGSYWFSRNLPWHLAKNNILEVYVSVEYEE